MNKFNSQIETVEKFIKTYGLTTFLNATACAISRQATKTRDSNKQIELMHVAAMVDQTLAKILKFKNAA